MRDDLKARCDTIEEVYEYLLAYAAQGYSGDDAARSGGQAREFLTRADTALTGLAALFTRLVAQEGHQPADRYHAFVEVLDRDARAAQAAIQLVLAQRAISSQLVDNLNASIHLRALLTDIFLIDEILKLQAADVPAQQAREL